METEHPVSTAIWQPQVALANKDKLYLFIFIETHFYDYSKPKWDFGIEFENYYQVLHKCRDSFWKVTAQWNREPIIHLLPQRVLRLHGHTMTVSSCKDWGEIRSGNRNQHPFRQTGLQFPGLNCSTLAFFRVKDGPCSFPWGQCCCRPRREEIQSSCCTNEKMAPASDWNMSWWHETAALAAFCPIIHQHLPPTELVKGWLRLFVVLQEVSSRTLLLHSRLGFLSHLASAMASERRFHLQALCHEGRKLPATSVLCRDDDTACLHACSLTVCYAFVAHTEKAYWLPLPSKNTHEENNSLFLPWICCSWVLTWIQIGIFGGSTLGWAMGMEKYRTPCYLQFIFVWKRWTQVLLSSNQVQGTPSWSRRQQILLLFLFHACFLIPLKNTFSQHAATQYPG